MAKRDPLPPRGENPIGKYAAWAPPLITVADARFLRSLRVAHDVRDFDGQIEPLTRPRSDDTGKGSSA